MALRQRGKNNFYHAYFRTVIAGRDGKLHYATRTVNLGTDDAIEAKTLDAELMKKNRAARLHQRAKAAMLRLEAEADLIAPESVMPPLTNGRHYMPVIPLVPQAERA